MPVRRASGADRAPAAVDGWTGPGWRLLERHEVLVEADGPRALAALLDLPLSELPAVRLLFRLRGLRFERTMTLAAFFGSAPFLRLEVLPDREAVYGIAAGRGRPIRLDGPETFRAAAAGASLAAVVNFRVEPGPVATLLSTETWARNHGRSARLAFGLYWLVVGPFSAWIRRMILEAARRRAEG